MADVDAAPLEAELPRPVNDQEEEEDVCRVCRVEGDEEMPLIYPCKCSGSVRYVHADCLKNWLAASQKKHCEICGYKYHFTKVYPDHIPKTIPPVVFLRQSLRWTGAVTRRILRVWLATDVWLLILPALNMSSLRTLLWAADFLSPARSVGQASTNATVATNTTATLIKRWDNETLAALDYMFEHPIKTFTRLAQGSWTSWNNGEEDTLVGYVFRGQLLTVSLAAVVIGFILIREWMAQHTMDEPIPPAEQGPINPDDFVIRGGVASAKDAAIAIVPDTLDTPERWWRRQIEARYVKAVRNIKRKLRRNERGQVKLKEIHILVQENRAVRDRMGNQETRANLAYLATLRQATLGSIKEKGDEVKLVGLIEALLDDFQSVGPYDPPPISIMQPGDEPRKRVKFDEEDAEGGEWEDDSDAAGSEAVSAEQAEPFRSTVVEGDTSATNGQASTSDSAPDSPTRSTSSPLTPPRPCNADPQGFEKAVSYAAPEQLMDSDSDSAYGGTRRNSLVMPCGADRDPGSDLIDLSGHDAEPEPVRPIASSSRRPPVPSTSTPDELVQLSYTSSTSDVHYASDDDGGDDNDSVRAISDGNAGRSMRARRAAAPVKAGPPPDLVKDEPGELGWGDASEDETGPSKSHEDDSGEEQVAPISADQPDGRDVGDVDLADFAATAEALVQRARQDMDEEREAPVAAGQENDHDHDHNHDHHHDPIGEDEIEGMDDWNGILELMGIIGPIQNLFQNVAFGFIIVGASMSLLVGVPIWIGRIFLSMDFLKTAAYTSVLVIKGTRLIFDPLIRVMYDFSKEVVVLPALSSLKAFERIVADSAGLGDTSLSGVDWMPAHAADWMPAHVFSEKAGDFFASIGSSVYTSASEAYDAHGIWAAKILASDKLGDRVWTMIYGYGMMAVAVLVVTINLAGYGSSTGRAMLTDLRAHTQFAKLGLFMFAELVIFPVMIGLVIQVCTVPILPDYSVEKLYLYLREVPFGALFTSWIMGTSFMFMFAGILQTLRKLCRRGVLFFIRDPSERTYNPVKDILDRPTASQLRKLGISAVMYTIVVIFLFGATCWGLVSTPLRHFQLLPLRTTGFGPLSTTPFDLLFFAIAISPTLAALRPSHRGRRLMSRWWMHTARAVNLGDMLTDWYHSRKQESAIVLRSWQALDVVAQIVLGRYNNAETLARVPASDSVVLLKAEERQGRGVFVRLDASGSPVTRDDKMMLLQQDRAARAKGRDPRKDYKMVWLPRYWRTRIHFVVLSALVLSGALVATAALAPLVVGRLTLDRAFGRPVHDGYNWLTGFYIIWAVCYLGDYVRRSIVISQLATRLRRSNASMRAKRELKSAVERSYVLAMLYLVIPALLGVSWELYIAMPIRYGLKSYTPVLHFWEAWAIGLVLLLTYVAILHDYDHAHGVIPVATGRAQEMRECYRNSFSALGQRVHDSTWRFALFMICLIAAPSLISVLPNLIYRDVVGSQMFDVIYRVGHPILLVACLVYICRRGISQEWSEVRQILIDAEYVIEERVENYVAEPEKPAVKTLDKKGKGKSKSVSFAELETETPSGGASGNEDVDTEDGDEMEEGDRNWEDVNQ